MDLRLFLTTFVAIFLAEIGDKTQLATLSFAAGGGSRWTVFTGSALALVTASAIAVLAGEALARAVPPRWIRRAAGVTFVVLGVLFLFTGEGGDGVPPGEGPAGAADATPDAPAGPAGSRATSDD